MRAEFANPAAVQDENAVCVARRRNAMRNEQGGSPLAQGLEPRKDMFFRRGVDTRETIVKKQYGRIADEPAGQTCALFLTAREGDAAFADERFQLLRKALDRVLEICRFRGTPDLAQLPHRIVVGDIVAELVSEKEWLLRDHGDLSAYLGERHRAHIVSIEKDGRRRRIQQTNDELE